MSMSVALTECGQIISIQDVSSGLACGCTCLQCGEQVVGRKGQIRAHHFAHYSNKKSCWIQPESLLHKFGKQVIREAMGLQLTPMPGHEPLSEDTSSWWDFESVEEEVSMGDLRPDLIAQLPDGPLLIEIAVTSFADNLKQELIQRLGLRAVEIDLSPWLSSDFRSLDEIRIAILHQVENRKWLYPVPGDLSSVAVGLPEVLVPAVTLDTNQPRFKIFGMWVGARRLPFGAIAVKSQVYNPQVASMLKQLARRYGGRYVPEYKNWLFQTWAEALVLGELAALDELVSGSRTPDDTDLHTERFKNGV